MKPFKMLIAAMLALASCHNSSTSVKKAGEKQSFFPVTTYIKGQISDIVKKGINPLKYTITENRIDSAWIPLEELNKAFQEFLYPVIDSTNLTSLFIEKKFLDQTLDAYTLTYDSVGTLPDSITLKHWDIYIHPATGSVKRIYMIKNVGNNKILQLTWQSSKWCKIVAINRENENFKVEREEKIIWDFNSQ